MIRKLLLISILTLPLLFSSCHSTKTAATGQQDEQFASTDDRLKSVISKSDTEWNVISVPVKLELKQPKSMSASGRAYIQRDSSIYISVRFLGMEVAVADINNDSIIVLDKVHRYYAAERLTDIFANVQFDINSIQSLLLARPFTHNAHISHAKQANMFKTGADIEDKQWAATPKKQNPLADYTFSFNDGDNMPCRTEINTKIGVVIARYSAPEVTAIGISPEVTSINIDAAKFNAKLDIKWSWDGVKVDNLSDRKHAVIPRGYQRIKAANVLKAFFQ